MGNDKNRILFVLGALISLSLVMIFYLTWFMVFKSEEVKHASANRRGWIAENQILRGTIYDRNGEILAYSDGEPGNYRRYYNHPRIMSHLVGYSNASLGKAGLEQTYDDYLLGRNGNKTWRTLLEWMGNKNKNGNNLILTVDTGLQQAVHDRLQETGTKCAAVVISPKTGEVYSMVSLPDYDSSTIREDWEEISKSTNGVLVDRTVSGKYPPGSTFKPITATAIIESGINQEYVDEGTQKIGPRVFKNVDADEAMGKVDLSRALEYSLNTYFVKKGVEVGQDKLGEVADRFGFNQKITFDVPLKVSTFDHKKKLDEIQLAASSIGQGDILATPMEMAMVAASIGNGGHLMQPYVVREVESLSGTTVKEATPTELQTVTTPEVAAEVGEMMRRVVTRGIGSNASIRGVAVAGKTGTAENASGKNHAWFIGYAPADDPTFAVAVVIEEADEFGSVAAAPIARDILIHAFQNMTVGD